MDADEDYALEPVPTGRTVSGYRIAIVSTGIIIALPAFISGAEIGFSLGFRHGAASVFIGGALLALIAMATGTIGARTRLNTAMLTRSTFGSIGGRIVSLILAISCLGWFGVTAEIFGRSVHHMLADHGLGGVPEPALSAFGGLLMIVTTIYGFSALQKLSNITVPLLAILIGYTAFLTLEKGGRHILMSGGAGGIGVGDGISAIVGGLAIAVTIFPDVCRFSRSPGDARIAALLTYAVAMPLIVLLGMIPSIATRQRDLILVMTMVGLGAPALLLLVVKSWTTNAGNLYFASLSAANLLPRIDRRWIIIVGGGLGIALAVAGISAKFIPFLIVLGVCIPPIAGIYVVDFLGATSAVGVIERIGTGPAVRPLPFSCWAIGIAVAMAAEHGLVTLTGIAACDSMLAAAAAYWAARRMAPRHA